MYKEYADIKFQLKALEVREGELKQAILEDLKKQKTDKLESEYGKFTIARRATGWKYSPKLQALRDDVKVKEKDEQENGKATCTETEYITYKTNESTI